MIQESLNEDRIGGLVRMMRWVIFSALSIEVASARLLLATRFVPIYGLGKGLWYGVFHSISAFCNAGFDLIGGYRNLMPFQYDPVVNLTVCLLIVIGGLGLCRFAGYQAEPLASASCACTASWCLRLYGRPPLWRHADCAAGGVVRIRPRWGR